MGDNSSTCEGHLRYCGGCSVQWGITSVQQGDSFSTAEGIQYIAGDNISTCVGDNISTVRG